MHLEDNNHRYIIPKSKEQAKPHQGKTEAVFPRDAARPNSQTAKKRERKQGKSKRKMFDRLGRNQ